MASPSPDILLLRAPQEPLNGAFPLPWSKSLANRQLILHALSGGAAPTLPPDLPEDVALLAQLLWQETPPWDAGAGGTTFRFLTAALALQGKQGVITGTARMCDRPVGPLVEGLRALGARIRYVGREGYPPLQLEGCQGQMARRISVDPSLSSQFLTALLLTSPILPQGLDLHLQGAITSRPYLDMTLRLLEARGFSIRFSEERIQVAPHRPVPGALHMESDWTSASYAYAHLALAPKGSALFLPGLDLSGWQGDEILAEWMPAFGVRTTRLPDGIRIEKQFDHQPDHLDLDLRSSPDLAQTLVVLAAVLGIPGTFRGLHTLAIKETDRTAALARELAKAGVRFYPGTGNMAGAWLLEGQVTAFRETLDTHHDHRMAMALSLLAWRQEIAIARPDVVRKSFPGFWSSLRTNGFYISLPPQPKTLSGDPD